MDTNKTSDVLRGPTPAPLDSKSHMVTQSVSPYVSLTPTNQVRVTSDTNLVSPSPVGVSDTNYLNSSNDSNNIDISSSVTPSPSLEVSPSPTLSSGFTATATPSPIVQQSGKININNADLSQLEEINGIGPVYAQRIIDYRQAKGPFQKIEDIVNVKGIGDKTFEKMKDQITVGG